MQTSDEDTSGVTSLELSDSWSVMSCSSNDYYTASEGSCDIDLESYALGAWEEDGGACQARDEECFSHLNKDIMEEDFVFVD